ncbi:MAG: PLP-dependent aminotransferase family protein [Lachnospiraceae bacterium]|nr:PLP-dependent aminotransferase family protein [Lachnospiraceae bacterium]
MTRYLKIYEKEKRKIVEGTYEYGEKLPSKRVSAEHYGVSVITIEHAYELLAEEGYIEAKEKSGYFVTYKESEAFGESASGHVNDGAVLKDVSVIASAVTSENADSETSESISFNLYAKTVRRVLADRAMKLTSRAEGFGCPELRRAIKDYLARYRGIYADTERIVIGAGAEYLYGLIVKALGRDRMYAVEYPSYQKIAKVYGAEHINLELLKLGKDGIESKYLWGTDAEVLHITPYRSYPTGVTASAAKKAEYLKWSVERNGLIIEDDFESEFTTSRKAEETLYSLDKNDRVIYVNTFTKTVGPFIRTAYMVIPKGLSKLFYEKIGFYACSVPVLEQYVLAELIRNGDFVRHINRVRRKRRGRTVSQDR